MPADFLVERGKTGLAQFGGRVASEWLAKLDGERGRWVFREMANLGDPTNKWSPVAVFLQLVTFGEQELAAQGIYREGKT